MNSWVYFKLLSCWSDGKHLSHVEGAEKCLFSWNHQDTAKQIVSIVKINNDITEVNVL